MTLAFEFNHKKLLFLVSLILVFSLVAPVSAQTDMCKVETDFLNLTEKNVMLESFQIIEVDFDHTYNTVYFTPKKEIPRGALEINFRNEREFRIFDFKVTSRDKILFFDPNVRIVEDNQGFSFHHELKFNGTETLKVTYWSNNVIQDRPAWMYPLDSYSLFLNNVDLKKGISAGKKFCFPEVDIDLYIPANVTVNYSCPLIPYPVTAALNPHIVGTKYVRIIGPITHTSERKIEDTEFWYLNLEDPEKKYVCNTTGSVQFDVATSFQRGQRTKWIFWIIFLYLTFAPWYVVRKSHNKNFWEKISEVYVTYSILPWLFSEITTSITPPSRPLTITLFDLTILWPFVLISIWWTWGKKERGISKFKGLFKRRD